MRNFFFIHLIIYMYFFSSPAFSAFICTPATLKIQNKNLILPGVDQPKSLKSAPKIYILHNISKKSLWIDHPVENKQGLKAGWSSFVQPDRWSAILINRKEFAINCAIIEPGKVNYQDCSKAITVCVSPQVKVDSKKKDNYWLVEDKTYEDLIANLTKRGFIVSK